MPEMERSKLVFFDRKKQFELEDLLRASPEMSGKGSFGTAYKAILNDGYVVVVKKLSFVVLFSNYVCFSDFYYGIANIIGIILS